MPRAFEFHIEIETSRFAASRRLDYQVSIAAAFNAQIRMLLTELKEFCISQAQCIRVSGAAAFLLQKKPKKAPDFSSCRYPGFCAKRLFTFSAREGGRQSVALQAMSVAHFVGWPINVAPDLGFRLTPSPQAVFWHLLRRLKSTLHIS